MAVMSSRSVTEVKETGDELCCRSRHRVNFVRQNLVWLHLYAAKLEQNSNRVLGCDVFKP